MTDALSIDLGSVFPYLEEKIRALFGKDALSLDATELLQRQARLAVRDAATVQVVGMDRPVSIAEIYQPTRLTRERGDSVVTFDDLVRERKSAIVFGRPGAGKTVLMHYVFMQLSSAKDRVPALFTLRRTGAPEDLLRFIEHIVKRKLKPAGRKQFVLLVDGYDEVSLLQRKQIGEALREYQASGIGPFFLTCRSYYPVDDIGAEYYSIAPFTQTDSLNFLKAFAKAYGTEFDAAMLLKELSERGFDDFVAHPLMLALVCILKAGSMRGLPRTTIGLLRRAVDTLTFRWDESKGVARDTKITLDGDDRVRCMMRVAYLMKEYVESDAAVQNLTADYLKLLQRPDIVPAKLLTEIAQWYGMLIPVADDFWTFAHRTVHDYLAARSWVESGTYASARVNTWNARAAYAACLLPDATAFVVRALNVSPDMAPFIECLYNNARFDVRDVAAAVVQHYRAHGGYSYSEDDSITSVETGKDFFRLASEQLLLALVAEGVRYPTSQPHKATLFLTLDELKCREASIPVDISATLASKFGDGRTFQIRRFDEIHSSTIHALLRLRGA